MIETSPPSRRGLPIWMPLLGMMVAFILVILVGARVCPVLSALVFPPEPPLPPGPVEVMIPQENQGAGRDEWVYTTSIPPCEVYAYYVDRVGGCNYDMDARCELPGWGMAPRDGASYPVGVCQGTDSIGDFFRVTWTVRIGGGYAPPNVTVFRITREVAN